MVFRWTCQTALAYRLTLPALARYMRTAWFVEMARAIREQRLDDARRLHHALAPVIRLLFAATNPGPLKAWLAAQGLVRNVLRAPMTVAPEALRAALAEAVASV